MVEILAGCLSILAFFHHPFFIPQQVPFFLFELFFVLNLLTLSTFDWRWKLLPIEWMIGSTVLFGIAALLLHLISIFALVIGFGIGFGFLWIQVVVSKGKWLGTGDPWLGGMIGAALGWPLIVVSLFSTYILGSLVALVLLATGRATKKTRIAFGPLLALGGFVALWFGNVILSFIHT